MKFFILGLLSLVISLSAFAQRKHFSPDERKIIELEDLRTGRTEIESYLKSHDEKTAWRAAIALANLGDTLARPSLTKQLDNEKRPIVIDGISFALGVLGPNARVYESLSTKAKTYGLNNEIAIAMARSVPKEKLSAFLETLDPVADVTHLTGISSALVELGLRKLTDDKIAGLVQTLSNAIDPTVRWRAVYYFSRIQDSAFLSRHIDIFKSFLNDLGSPECRMFAATALGNLHTHESYQSLITAARSETEWRVQVNIFNALAKQQFFTSAIFDVIKRAVSESSKDTPTTFHPAFAALTTLDKMIADGKVSSPDSVAIREWLSDFSAESHIYDAYPQALRASALVAAGRFDTGCIPIKGIAQYYPYRLRPVSYYASRALGNRRDTEAMFVLLHRIFGSSLPDFPGILEGLRSQWKMALSDNRYWKKLDAAKFTASYRHLVIRFADQEVDPAVVGLTMEMIQDPKVIVDSFTVEAKEYLTRYIHKYNDSTTADQLGAIIEAIGALKFTEPYFADSIRKIYHTAASVWGNTHLADIAYRALDSLGAKNIKKEAVIIHRIPIDWDAIEHAPDTVLVPSYCGSIYIHLLTEDAPLSVLNILKLAKTYYFANTYFHRVVPNFVAQAGDMTGTGWGGPGYSIRTEISPVRYDSEGVCGMASDGKDTEGSQWFITHCPTPHLNTRYSIWGNVVKRMECINNIQLDDQVQNVIPYR